MRLKSISMAALLVAAVACRRGDPLKPETGAGVPPPVAAPQALRVFGGLQGPESVLYDPDQDVYFISNINGGELAVDGNGFITRVDANTLQADVKWIESGRGGVTLDGPKGMTILGDTLYVSDCTAVRLFNRRTGAPMGSVPMPGAAFVNDLANDGHSVFVTDTGLRMGPGETFVPTGTDAVYRIDGQRAVKIASGDALLHPNGLDVIDGHLWVATFGGHELYRLDDGKPGETIELPAGQLDGVVHEADGTLLVSSWAGHAVYRRSPHGDFETLLQGIGAPADIGYDTKRHRLLVPRSTEGEVTVHAIQ